MDEIEAGFQKLIERIGKNEKERESLKEQVKNQEAALFGRMISLSAPLISSIGIRMLLRGKQDTKGELYDTVFHNAHTAGHCTKGETARLDCYCSQGQQG